MHRILLTALCLLTTANLAVAADKVIETASGTTVQAEFSPNDSAKKFHFVFFSTKEKLSTLSFTATAPGKTAITVKALGVPKSSTLQQASASLKSAYSLEVSADGGRHRSSIAIGSSNGVSNPGNGSGEKICNGHLDKSLRDYYRMGYMAIYDREPTDDELCDFAFQGDSWRDGSSGGGSGASLSSINGSAPVLKDLCSSGKSKYLVDIILDFSKVKSAERAAGFTVELSTLESSYGGPSEVKVKRKGAGMYPVPLTLGRQLGGFTTHLIAKFSGGSLKKIKGSSKAPIKKSLNYRGMYLDVSIPGHALSGGKGNFFVYNPEALYGACIKLVPSDQRYNGYVN